MYKRQVVEHHSGLGWIVVEWKNAKMHWKSTNYATKELAETKMRIRERDMNRINNQAPVKRLSREEVVTLFGKQTFPKRKQLKR